MLLILLLLILLIGLLPVALYFTMPWIKKITSVCAYVCDCSHDDRFNGLVAVINAYIIKHSKFPFYDSSISKLFSDPNCQDMIRSWNQKHTWSYSNIVNTLDNTTDFGIHLCTLKVICHSLLHINLKCQFSKSDGDYLNSSSIMDALRNCSIMGHSAIVYGFVPGDGKHPHYSATFSRYLVVSMALSQVMIKLLLMILLLLLMLLL